VSEKINEDFIEINTETRSIPAAFVGENRDEEFMRLGYNFIMAGKQAHKENCDNDENCIGSTPYIMRELKSYLLLHPELTILEQMCLVSVVAYSRGINRGEYGSMDRSNVIEMNANDIPTGLKELLKRLIKDGPKKPD